MQEDQAAPQRPRIGVVGLHRPGTEAEDQPSLERILQIIGESERADAVDPEDVARSLGGRRELVRMEGLLGPGRELLAEGRNLYQQARPEDAVGSLERAVAALRAGMAGANSTRDLWEAWVYLGTSLLALDREEAARFALASAVALNPGRSPNPGLFPPRVLELWEDVRAEGEAQILPLQIDTPADAEVYLDGQSLGMGPRSVDVLPGEHFLVARGPSGHAFQRLRVQPDSAPPPVDLQARPPVLGSPAATGPDRSRQIAALYRALGAHVSNVDLLLLAGTDPAGMSVQLYSPRTDAFSRPIQRDAIDDEALGWSVSGLLGMVERDGSLVVTTPTAVPLDLGSNETLSRLLLEGPRPLPPEPAPEPEPERRGIRPAAVLGGLAGALVAGAGTGLAVHLLTRSPEPPHDGTIVVGPF